MFLKTRAFSGPLPTDLVCRFQPTVFPETWSIQASLHRLQGSHLVQFIPTSQGILAEADTVSALVCELAGKQESIRNEPYPRVASCLRTSLDEYACINMIRGPL
jgi:hypothetical protein